MPDVLYAWPSAARVGRRVPKESLYGAGHVSPAVRELFVSSVDRITWDYKLAGGTIGISGTPEVPEIQVFRVRAKGDDVPDQVLAAIDRVVQQPVFFEVTRGLDDAEVRLGATYKIAGSAPAAEYARTAWLPASAPRRPIPTGVDMAQVYAQVLRPLLGVRMEPGERPQAIAARLVALRELERRHAAVASRHRRERQFNRKVELRKELKGIEQEMEQWR